MPKKRPFVIGLPSMVQKTISYLIIILNFPTLSNPPAQYARLLYLVKQCRATRRSR